MKIKDEMINKAVDALQSTGIVVGGLYSKEFKGYISSFGAAVIQSGLLPAVIFYEDNGNSDEERSLLIRAIVVILNDEMGYNIQSAFSEFIRINDRNKQKLTEDVSKAAVSLKLALRIFEKRDNEKQNEEE